MEETPSGEIVGRRRRGRRGRGGRKRAMAVLDEPVVCCDVAGVENGVGDRGYDG